MQVAISLSVERNSLPVRLARMVAPVVSRLSECGHFLRLIGKQSEKGDGHGDCDFVTLFIPKIDADEALPIIIDDGSKVHGVGAERREKAVRHDNPSRGGCDPATIAEAGGAASAPGGGLDA
jgi:hypothetical protein